MICIGISRQFSEYAKIYALHPADAQDDEFSKLLDGGVEQHTDAIEPSDRKLSSKKRNASNTEEHAGRTRSAQGRKETAEGTTEGTAQTRKTATTT